MMIDSASILHDLDLLDDWLAGKGYGEEAGLVLRAMTLINGQARELRELRAENEKLRSELEAIKSPPDYGTQKIMNEQIHYAGLIAQKDREIARLRAENEKLRDMLLRSDKLTRQEWYDMRNAQLAEEAKAAALKETGE